MAAEISLLNFGLPFLNETPASKIATGGTSVLQCGFYLEIV